LSNWLAPTLLIDEADTFLKENDELRGILNTGHKRGGQILRTVGEDHEPRQFSTWAPTAIAMIGRLPDTLNDRSVVINLRRRKPQEGVMPFRSDRANDIRLLARKMARWAQDHTVALTAADPDMGQLMNRVADNWRPLFAIAEAAGGKWPTHVRSIAQAAEAQKDDQSIKAMLLCDIRDIRDERPREDRIGSAELASILGSMEDRPWSEWGRSQKPITASALSRLLSPFGILTGTRRKGDEVFKGYIWSAFDEAFASYLPEPAFQTVTRLQRDNDGHFRDSQSATPEKPVTVLKSQKPNNDGHCNRVTVVKAKNGGSKEEGENDDLTIPACLDRRHEPNGRAKQPCAQCSANDGQQVEINSVWLHKECKRFWDKGHRQ
jgi:Protein of unknown function (DUF3631)